MSQDYKVEFTKREVIEGKLLARLSEKGQVAILATKTDLFIFLGALQHYEKLVVDLELKREITDMLQGIKKLLEHL